MPRHTFGSTVFSPSSKEYFARLTGSSQEDHAVSQLSTAQRGDEKSSHK